MWSDGGDARGHGGELEEGALLPLRHAQVPLGSPAGGQTQSIATILSLSLQFQVLDNSFLLNFPTLLFLLSLFSELPII